MNTVANEATAGVTDKSGKDGTGSGGGGGGPKSLGGKGGDGVVIVRISAIVATSVDKPSASESLVYNGLEQIGVAESSKYQFTSGVNKAIEAGQYTCKVKPTGTLTWSDDGTQNEIEIHWSIARREVAAPAPLVGAAPDYAVEYAVAFFTPQTNALVDASGARKPYSLTMKDEKGVDQSVIDAQLKKADAGTYAYTATLDVNYVWAGESGAAATSPKSFTWTITRKPLAKPFPLVGDAPDYRVPYTGLEIVAQTQPENDSLNKLLYSFVVAEATDKPEIKERFVGDYSYTAQLGSNYCWSDGSTDDVVASWSIAPAAIEKPTSLVGTPDVEGAFAVTYTGENFVAQTNLLADAGGQLPYTYAESEFESDGAFKLESADVGSFHFVAVLNANYTWTDGSRDPVKVKWRVNLADNKIHNLAIEGWEVGMPRKYPSATADFGTIEYTYSQNAHPTEVFPDVWTNAPKFVPGTWYVRAFVPGTSNYEAAEDTKPFTLTAGKGSGYRDHITVSVDGYRGSLALTDFPVLVKVSTALAGFSWERAGDSGTNLAFSVGQDFLPYETVKWSPEEDEAEIWVKVPSLPPAGTTLMMHWCPLEETTAALQPYEPTKVWSSFHGVWHFDEEISPSVAETTLSRDSSANRYDLTPMGKGMSIEWTNAATNYWLGNDLIVVYRNSTLNGTLVIPAEVEADVLLVGGGGGGGGNNGGGGGAGGFVEKSGYTLLPNTYAIKVGGGGNGGGNAANGANGTDSSLKGGAVSLVAYGGGGGARGHAGNYSGATGASGGGSHFTTGAATTHADQGFKGGDGVNGIDTVSGGGGGAGGPGEKSNCTTHNGAGAGNDSSAPGMFSSGNGGVGKPSSITGEEVWWAGGGGGGTYAYRVAGGMGGRGGGGHGIHNGTADFGVTVDGKTVYSEAAYAAYYDGKWLNAGYTLERYKVNGVFDFSKYEAGDATRYAGTDGLGGGGGGALRSGTGAKGGSGVVIVRIKNISTTGAFSKKSETASGSGKIALARNVMTTTPIKDGNWLEACGTTNVNFGAFTLSGWMYVDALNADSSSLNVVASKSSGYKADGWAFGVRQTPNPQYLRLVTGSNEAAYKQISSTTVAGHWQYFSVSYDPSDGKGAILGTDGSYVSTTDGYAGLANCGGAVAPLRFGGMPGAYSLKGRLDEVRLAKGVRSSDWSDAQVDMATDADFLSYGAVNLDGVYQNRWLVVPSVDKTAWFVGEEPLVVDPGLAVANDDLKTITYVNRATDEVSPTMPTEHGLYIAVAAIPATDDTTGLEIRFDFQIRDRNPYDDFDAENNGLSGRVLLMNRDTNEAAPVDYQGYNDSVNRNADNVNLPSFWEHVTFEDNTWSGGPCARLLESTESILWTRNYQKMLWHIVNARMGNTYPDKDTDALTTTYCYLPWSSTSYAAELRTYPVTRRTVGQINLRNILDARVVSSWFTDGIGTVYFDAVDFEGLMETVSQMHAHEIVVEYSTDAEDDDVAHEMGTNTWTKVELHPVLIHTGKRTAEPEPPTKAFNLVCPYLGNNLAFYRIYAPINCRQPCRFRIRRSTYRPTSVSDRLPITLDNIIVSYPQQRAEFETYGIRDDTKTGKQVMGQELAWNTPFPSAKDPLIARAKPVFYPSAGATVPDEDLIVLGKMHYRWVYLNQITSEWKTVTLYPHLDYSAEKPLELPGAQGDVEYWYELEQRPSFYEYVDYTGADFGLGGVYSEEVRAVTNRSSMLEVKCDHVWNRIDEREPGETTIGYTVDECEICHMTWRREQNSLRADYRSIVPAPYVDLEYVESKRAQYVDLGFSPTATTCIHLDFYLHPAANQTDDWDQDNGERAVFGTSWDWNNNNWLMHLRTNAELPIQNNSNLNPNHVSFWDKRMIFDIDSTGSTLRYFEEGTLIGKVNSTRPNAGSSKTLYLFGSNKNDGRHSATRVYSMKIWSDDAKTKLIRDLVPAKDKDGVPGLYDLVEKKFYKSGTATALVAGDTLPEGESAGPDTYVAGENLLKDWFVRQRDGVSDYEGMTLFVEGKTRVPGSTYKTEVFDQKIEMELVKDHVWRGYVKTPTNIADNVLSYRIEGVNRQTPGAKEFAYNRTCWYQSEYIAAYPMSGSLSEGSDGDWQQLPVDSLTGYLLVQVDDSANSVTVLHADYCDMNSWNDANKGEGVFTGSSITNETKSGVSPAAREYHGDFKAFGDSSPTSKYWEEHFDVDVSSGTHGYKLYEKFLSETTPNGWRSGTGQWVYGKYMDKESGLALQMFGQGQGELVYTESVVEPRGLESLSFNARLSQFVDLEDLCENFSEGYGDSDYAILARSCFDTASNTAFGGSASLSMFGYYRPKKGAYEYRITWIGAGTKDQEMALYRWNYTGTKGYVATRLCAYTNSNNSSNWSYEWPKAEAALGTTARYAPISISLHTSRDYGTIVSCGFSKKVALPGDGNELMITNKNWSGFTYVDNTSSKLTAGTFGFMSANCPARFYKPLKLACASDKITSGAKTYNNDYNGLRLPFADLGPSVPRETEEQNEGDWAVPTGRIVGYHDDYGGGFKAQPVTQRLDIYTSKLGYENWGEEPVATVSFDDFGSVAKEFKFYRTDDCSVRIAVGGELDDVRTDITIDDVVMRQWRGDEISNTNTMGEAGISTKDTNYTYGCITNFTFHSGWFTNGCVRLSARRTESGSPCGVRSPMFDGIDARSTGLGMFSVGYADAQSNCRLLLQIATNVTYTSLKSLNASTSALQWHTVTNWDFRTVDPIRREKGTLSCYVGLHGVRGVMRLVVDPALVDELKDRGETNPSLFGEITVTGCLARDEPMLDESCWWGWNVGMTTGEKRAYMPDWPVVAGDPGGMNLALNNPVPDALWSGMPATPTEPMKLHMPFVQTPTFSTNVIGEVTFRARKYDPAEEQPQASYVTLYGSTTGSLVDDAKDWKQLCVFAVTNSTFELFTFKVDPASSYKAFRLANAGVPGVDQPGANPEPGTQPCRVLIDEVLVSEAIRARVAFRNVAAFRDNLAGTESLSEADLLRKDQQPLLGEQWGVQAEVYPAMLPDEVDFTTRGHEPKVKLYWFEGDYPWGFDKWRDRPGAKSAYLSRAVGGEEDAGRWIFRSSQQLSPNALIAPSAEPDTVVQFMLEVEWYQVGSSEMQTTRLQPGEWSRPSWYSPLDYNRDYGKGLPTGFSAYTILNAISPGWAWINEVNLFGDEEDRSGNSDRNCQYVEVAAPAEADIRGWKLQMLVASSKGLLETNLLATFGTDDVKSMKDATYSSANMVFHVIGSPLSSADNRLRKNDGTLDGTWPSLTTSKSSAMKNGVIDPNEPVGFLLERPNGIVEHVVTALGTNFWTSLGDTGWPSPKWLSGVINSGANLGSFSLGEDCNTRTNSLGVFASRGEGPVMWNDTMAKTPGRINAGQTINPDHPTPNGGSIIVYASVDQAGGPIVQTVGDAFDTTSTKILVVPAGSTRGTNIVYRVPPWYAIESVKTNGVAIAGADVTETGVREWTVNVAKGCSNNVTVVARAKVEDRLARDYGLGEENPYTPAVLEWLRGGSTLLRGDFANDGELQLADYVDLNTHATNRMTLTQMYWLDMDPTVGGLVLESGVGTPEGVDREWGAVTMHDKLLPVYMCVKSRSDGDEWSPYVLRGLGPGETSWDYPAQYGGGNWTSVTFKVVGMLNNGLTKYDNPDNWIPLRWFVFKEDSFDADHLSEVELIDPTSKSSMGYGAGWYDWVKAHGDPGFFFKSTIDTRLRPIAVEVLHPENLYE